MVLKRMQHETHKLNLPETWPVACHTDHVGPGTTFVVIRGQSIDGVIYIADAINKGASRIVVSCDTELPCEVMQLVLEKKVTAMRVLDTRLALAQLSAAAYNHPAEKLIIAGVTGTKGKTTTVTLLHHLLISAGIKAALISTVENKINGHLFKAPLTTPQPDYIHMFLDVCVREGVTHVVMEVAAQALTLHRVHGIRFDVGTFTNFAHEHLEFYASMEAYFHAKCLLREHMKTGAPIIVNDDDIILQQFVYEHVVPVSLQDIVIERVLPIEFNAIIAGDFYPALAPYMMGRFNVYNILYALHCAHYLGIAKQDILRALMTFVGVRGRLQKQALPNGATCYVDYAHTPDSYAHVLGFLRSMTKDLIVVFGCGGLRDKSKRPIMGGIAASIADYVVLTSDNPRTEDPVTIMADIKEGVAPEDMYKIVEIVDRAQAIGVACAKAENNTIVAILGKGADEYQIVGATKNYFSDIQVIETYIYKQRFLT